MVVTPSPYLENELRQHIRKDMTFRVIPDAVEKAPASPAADRPEHAKALAALDDFRKAVSENGISAGRRLVWFGVSGTQAARNGMYDVEAYCDVLRQLNAEAPLSLSIVSDDEGRYRELFANAGFTTHYLDWNFFTFNPALKLHDIAILPIRTNRYTLSKSANRITTAFDNGLAVCASLIPSYEPFQGVAVFDDWNTGLAELMGNPQSRQARIAQAGQIIAEQYSLPVIAGAWRQVFDELS